MTPKNKAQELVDKMPDVMSLTLRKMCALIAVDEILNSFDAFMDSRKNMRHELEIEAERYWQQIKNEISTLS